MKNVPEVEGAFDRWLAGISVARDWWQECGLSAQTPDLRHVVEDGEGNVLASSASKPGLPLFCSEIVDNPISHLPAEDEITELCNDVIFHVGGSVWALDWCPCRPGWVSRNIQNEFLLVGAHPAQAPQHRLGEALHGPGLLQIWEVDLSATKRSEVRGEEFSTPVKARETEHDNEIARSRGEGRGRGRGASQIETKQDRLEAINSKGAIQSLVPAETEQSACTLTGGEDDVLLSPLLTHDTRRIERGRGRGRGRGWKGRGRPKVGRALQEKDRAIEGQIKLVGNQVVEGGIIVLSDPEHNDNPSLEDDDVVLSDFLLKETVRGAGRKRGRSRAGLEPREQKFLGPELDQGTSDAQEPSAIMITPEASTPDKGKQRLKNRARAKHIELRVGPIPSPPKSSLPENVNRLPRMVLGIAHEGEVIWDAKWRPLGEVDETRGYMEHVDEREPFRLGFLAAILGDGSVQVFDIPLPSMLEVGIRWQRKAEKWPLIVQMDPAFRCSDLRSNGHKSIPLTLEWSTWNPHEMLLVGCHDGTVAVFKVFPCSSPFQESRPLVFFTADYLPLRTVAWAPDGSGPAGKHLVSTAGQSGYVRFWDLRGGLLAFINQGSKSLLSSTSCSWSVTCPGYLGWVFRDPYRPMLDIQISRACITSIDWLAAPRCMLISMDDGSLRLLGFDHSASDTPVTGKPYSGTQFQGLQSYYCSLHAMWLVHASRDSGLVAYCGSDGNVLHFQLTEKAILKEGARHRKPHYLSGGFAADSETGSISVISQNLAITAQMRKFLAASATPSRRECIARRNQAARASGESAGFLPSGTPFDFDKPASGKRKSDEGNAKMKSAKKRKAESSDELSLALVQHREDFDQSVPSSSRELALVPLDEPSFMEGDEGEGLPPNSGEKLENESSSGPIDDLPLRVVSMQRIRWNFNKGRETWLAFGGASGIIRCQHVLPRD